VKKEVVEAPMPVFKEKAKVEAPSVLEEKPEAVEETIDNREEAKAEIKVVGKIDLEKAAKAKKTKKEEAEVEPEPLEEDEAAPEPTEEKEELVRAETPQLQGLKILGKIDTEKFDREKKKREEEEKAKEKEKEAAKAKKKQEEEKRRKRRRRRTKVKATNVGDTQTDRSRRGKKTEEVKEVSQKEIDEKIRATMARLSGGRQKKRQKIRRDKRETMREKQELEQIEKESKAITLTEFVTAQELANLMDVSVTDIITTCMNLGVIVSINQRLDAEIIELLAEEFGHEVDFISAEEDKDEEEEIVDDPADLEARAPIVTVMGHVDHGKTSLLDYIREANVVGGEAGGITQHIGAYEVVVGSDKRKITFLDTPGHEAFTAMRARGAKVTDIAVIIIAADDRIMPQTKEAISHAQAAGVPMIFAINKIDKPGADPEKIKQELASLNFLVEDWGGKYQSQDISAKAGTNIDQLLEKIILEADLLELQANPDRMAVGTIIEASLDKGRGYICKLLVTNGSLQVGDTIVAGEYAGKVKAMFNERGKRVKVAGPSTPVLILGLSGAPQAGEKFRETETEQEARQIATKRSQISREQANRASKRISLDEIGRRLALGTFKELNLIVKGDVDGSIEALSDSLIKLSQETVQVNVIHKAVGQIIESDVLLATASDAIVIGFQVRPSLGARKLAETEGVEIKTYSIIYEAIDEIKSAIEGMLEPTREEKITGQLEVREVYKISRVGTVAGCYVEDGKIARDSHIRLIREGIVVYPTKAGTVGEIGSLKRFKDDVKEVRSGMECGVMIKNFNDIKVGDVIEAFNIIEVKQTIDG
jgi:translation initiation factor IF-2